jgi:hypothetical protein
MQSFYSSSFVVHQQEKDLSMDSSLVLHHISHLISISVCNIESAVRLYNIMGLEINVNGLI